MRSIASRGAIGGISRSVRNVTRILDAAGYNLILIESVGVGQVEIELSKVVNLTLVIFTPHIGDNIQAVKAGLNEIGDIYVINKGDLEGATRLYNLILDFVGTSGQNPAVMKVSAKTSTGITDLAVTVKKLLKQDDKLQKEKEKRMLELEIRDMVLNKIEQEVFALLDKDDHIYRLVDKLLKKEIDPYQVCGTIERQGIEVTDNMETSSFKTDSEIPVKRVYKGKDLRNYKKLQEADPGKFPYLRGLYRNMYRERLWTMRQYSGFGSTEETNARFRFLLDHGQTGLSLAFDLPTQTGRDSDHRLAEGEVGRTGVTISSIEDMMSSFANIPLDKVSTSMTINSTASTLLALYITVAESQGLSPPQIRGTTQNDILKEYIARNTYIYPPKPSMRLIGDMIQYLL